MTSLLPDEAIGLSINPRLRRIADLLERPVTAFSGSPQMRDELETSIEMLRLWFDLPDDADRRKLLAFARKMSAA